MFQSYKKHKINSKDKSSFVNQMQQGRGGATATTATTIGASN